MSYKGELVDEDRLFEMYYTLLGYVPDSDREDLAQHIYDWLRAWDAPMSVFDGMSDHDTVLANLAKDHRSSSYDDDDEFESEDSDSDSDYDDYE